MPASPSTRLGLVGPLGGEDLRLGDDIIRALITTLDPIAVKFDAGARASRPVSTVGSPGMEGRIYESTDDGGVDWDSGTKWKTLRPGYFSALPSTQLDDRREIFFQTAAMSTAGVAPWRLRYIAATGWDCISGRALSSVQSAPDGLHSTASLATFSAMANGPSIMAPLTATYRVRADGSVQNKASAGIEARVAVAVNGAAGFIAGFTNVGAVNNGSNTGGTADLALTAGDVLSLQVATNNLVADFGNPTPWMMTAEMLST
jgi:hypothetical protein